MDLRQTWDVDEYAAAVTEFLEAEPCARNVLHWVIDVVRTDPEAYDAPPSFWWIVDAGTVCGAASMTPPFPLLVSTLPDGAAPLLAGAALARATSLGHTPPGVNGPASSARAVAAAWAALSGRPCHEGHVLLLHELETLIDVPAPPGRRRAAGADDVDLLIGWVAAFAAETGVHAGADSRHSIRRMVDLGSLDVWDVDDGPTSMAGHRAPVAGVVRVGPVYTPPEHRTRGYARRLTHEVSARALRRPGVRRCMLFTDAANPVSNSIYRQAGYVPGAEHVEMRFD